MRGALLRRDGVCCLRPSGARNLGCLFGALVLVLALPSPDASPVSNDDHAAIQRLLQTRAHAVMADDESAFMSTVAPGSTSFARRQRRLFRSVTKIPLASYDLRAAWGRLGDLARPADRVAHPRAKQVAIPVTEERYRIRGFDDIPLEEDLYYTFVEQHGRWMIASDRDLDGLGLQSARQLWDFGSVEMDRSQHFLLLTHPCPSAIGCARLPADMLAIAERALRRVDRFWRAPWRHRIVILAPSTTAELRRLLQATFDVKKFVAFAYAGEDLEHGLRFVGRRIVLNWRSIANRTSDSVLTILAHELTHVATRERSGPQIPAFVEEGIAEYVGYDADPSSLGHLRSVVGAGGFDGKLPRDYQFTTGSGRDIYLSYQKAESAVRFFIGRWGMARFVRFYTLLGRRRVVTGTPHFHLDQALQEATGLGYTGFQKQWASSLRQ